MGVKDARGDCVTFCAFLQTVPALCVAVFLGDDSGVRDKMPVKQGRLVVEEAKAVDKEVPILLLLHRRQKVLDRLGGGQGFLVVDDH